MKDRVTILTEENICDLLNLYGELNKMLGKNRKCMVIKNTSNYLKRYNGKSLTTGMMNFANYTVFRKFYETHRKALFTGNYDEVVKYIRNIS